MAITKATCQSSPPSWKTTFVPYLLFTFFPFYWLSPRLLRGHAAKSWSLLFVQVDQWEKLSWSDFITVVITLSVSNKQVFKRWTQWKNWTWIVKICLACSALYIFVDSHVLTRQNKNTWWQPPAVSSDSWGKSENQIIPMWCFQWGMQRK